MKNKIALLKNFERLKPFLKKQVETIVSKIYFESEFELRVYLMRNNSAIKK